MRTKHKQTGDKIYYVPENKVVLPEDFLTLRHHGGLPGHAEAVEIINKIQSFCL